MKNINSFILLNNLYQDLSRLRTDYDTGFEELINGSEIMKNDFFDQKWLNELLSDNSINLFKVFKAEWSMLLKSKSYACIGVYMQLDKDWIGILNNSLLTLICSVEQDLILSGKEFQKIEQHNKIIVNCDGENLLKITDRIFKLSLKESSMVNPFLNLNFEKKST